MFMTLNQKHINYLNDTLGQKVINIITNEFSDLDLVFHYEKDNRVYYIEEPKTWNKFIEWITAIISNGGFFLKKMPTLFVINIDMISRIPKPKKKTTKKAKKKKKVSKKKAMTPLELINIFRFKTPHSIIFLSEKPVKENRIGIRPTIFGNIPDYTNKIWIIENFLYSNDKSLQIRILQNCRFETFVQFLFFQSMKHKQFQQKVIRFMKTYYQLRFETTPESLNKLILYTFSEKLEPKSVRYPKFYKELYGLKEISDTLNVL